MSAGAWLRVLLETLGGLALFLFAIRLMTSSIQAAAGPSMRRMIALATRGRWTGLAWGTLSGFLLHSSASTVLFVGFLHAGLLTLAQVIGPIAGANIVTTLSMQLISIKLGAYYYVPLLAGMAMTLAVPHRPWEQTGRALVGFGLLFLAMNIMSGAIAPHRDLVRPWLAAVHQPGLAGSLLSLGIATGVTVLIQSSGATIGILFALIQAGALHDIQAVLPLVLGAHIGTCSTALLGSIGASVEARRGAIAHLLFNLVGSALALAASGPLLAFIRATSDDLLRQTANLHTAVMAATALAVLPLRAPFVRAVCALAPARGPQEPSSFLDEDKVDKPEQALYQAIRELQRVARIGWQSFRLNAEIMFNMDARKLRTVRKNEDAIDEIQRAMKRYLESVATRYLSRRQSILLQHLNRCMIDIERIGDHNDNLADLAERRYRTRGAVFPSDAQALLFSLFEAADEVLKLVIQSLNPAQPDFQVTARLILQARDAYAERSLNAKAHFSEKVARHEYSPIVGIFLSEYVASFDRIVRHAKMIALAESQPYFWIKRKKLDRVSPEASTPPAAVDEPHDFLDKLQSEGFI